MAAVTVLISKLNSNQLQQPVPTLTTFTHVWTVSESSVRKGTSTSPNNYVAFVSYNSLWNSFWVSSWIFSTARVNPGRCKWSTVVMHSCRAWGGGFAPDRFTGKNQSTWERAAVSFTAWLRQGRHWGTTVVSKARGQVKRVSVQVNDTPESWALGSAK